MKAAVVTAFGAPLRVKRIHTPHPPPGRCWSGWKPAGSATPTSTPPTATGRSNLIPRSCPAMKASAASNRSAST